MDPSLLGKVLASILTASIDAGAIATNPQGVVSDPEKLAQIAQGFLGIWLSHPASGHPAAALEAGR